jgi:hypothetical protein
VGDKTLSKIEDLQRVIKDWVQYLVQIDRQIKSLDDAIDDLPYDDDLEEEDDDTYTHEAWEYWIEYYATTIQEGTERILDMIR